MTHVANTSARTYRSELRAEQVEATKARILDAAGRVMADGIAGVSIPGIAREAGVSVATVYRHFATKTDLLAAMYPHLLRRTGLDELVPPRSIEDLKDGVRALFEHTDSFDDLARAAMASPASGEVRRLSMARRLSWAREFAESNAPRLAEADRDRIARLIVVLTASSSVRMWRDQLGSSVDEAADDVDWVVRAVIRAATGAATRGSRP
jgi:AcrR family transcriptional regulator